MKFYHNPRCSKSRQGLSLLEENGLKQDLEIVLYLTDVPSVAELKQICSACKINPSHLLRVKESIYKDLVIEFGKPSEDQALTWMHENPKLIERPILINGTKGRIGRPSELLLEII